MFKKNLSMLLCVVLMFNVNCFALAMKREGEKVFKKDGFEYGLLEDGSLEIKNYFLYDSDLIIFSDIEYNGKDYKVSKIADSAFYNNNNIKNIIINEGILRIEENAFFNCIGLKKIFLPNSLVYIGKGAFFCCESLSTLVIPRNVGEINDLLCTGCRKLESVTFENLPSIIGLCAFENCENLKFLKLPKSVEMIEDGAFKNCTSLIDIKIPEETKKIGIAAFYNCRSLLNIILPRRLKEIKERTFCKCHCLKKIKLPYTLKSICSYAFSRCCGLSEIFIPASVQFIEENAFFDWDMNQKIYFNKSVINNSSFIGLIDGNVIAQEKIYILGKRLECRDVFCKDKFKYEVLSDGTLAIFANGKLKGDVCIPSLVDFNEVLYKVSTIGFNAFSQNEELISVSLPKSITKIEDNAFQFCPLISTISIPESVIDISPLAFNLWNSRQKIRIANRDVINNLLLTDCNAKIVFYKFKRR